MSKHSAFSTQILPDGVMFNAYPDSIGSKLSDTVDFLQRPELQDAFSMFYILPTFFHSDLDRGFSIIDYDLNEELVSPEDLVALGINIKLDLVLNHLSVRSPQFVDLMLHGKDSIYREFFVDWNEFWKDHGTMGADDYVVPEQKYLDALFMRKPDLPILKVRIPDGSAHVYWNTFYQKIQFEMITAHDLETIEGMDPQEAAAIADNMKCVVKEKGRLVSADLKAIAQGHSEVITALWNNCEFLGQMDLNARSELVWNFYDDTLRKLSEYGAKIVRLDAFAYLHKEPGQPNFFNRPGTWEYLERLRGIAQKYNLLIFPEIHTEYGAGVHEEIAQQGYPIYDFFFPGLVIDALERGSSDVLLRWIGEIRTRGLHTINMLGSHDGIPVLDLKGKQVDGSCGSGLLSDEQIEAVIDCILERGGLTKNLYSADGKKVDYYQVNATFFSALGEDEQKLRLARAIQMFMPGVPQVWYLDLFAGTNDYAAAKRGRTAGHKEINRTNLKMIDIESALKRRIIRDQLDLIRLRNTSLAFKGEMKIIDTEAHLMHIVWQHPQVTATLKANLRELSFTVYESEGEGEVVILS